MVTALQDVLTLERIDLDIFRGTSPPSTLPRTFGGQVAGQALVAATQTVGPGVSVHSLHAYFLRAGQPGTPAVYRVDRLRDGRSFATRRITALQHGEAIFSMAASFHRTDDDGPSHADPAPAVPSPAELEGTTPVEGGMAELHEREWPDWELRPVPRDRVVPREGTPVQQQVWLRHVGDLPDDPVFHVCALAYASDMTLLGCARVPHEQVPTQIASLDHAMWFLRPFRADQWLLYDQTSPSAGSGRGLTQGRIFGERGELVATVVQEGLLRTERTPR